jgi:hypothetical protein
MAEQTKRREDQRINVGFGQSRAIDPTAARQPSLAQRALAGEFQTRPRIGAPTAAVNVGTGATTADSPRAVRTLGAAPAAAPRPAAAVAPAATAALAAAPLAAPPARRGRVSVGPTTEVPQPGDMNTYTGGNGVTRRIEPAPAAAAVPPAAAQVRSQPVIAPASNAPAVQQSVVRALDASRGQTRTARADAAEILNPMSNSAELMRRLENSQGSYFYKGSPQARRLIGEAIAGQLGAQNAATMQGQRTAGDVIERGVGYEAMAGEGAARRQLDADTFNVEAGYRDRTLAAEQQRPTGALVRGLDGNTTMLRNDGSTTTLRDEAGNAIQTPAPAQAGALTPAALLESYTAQAEAINQGLGNALEKEQQQAALRSDPIYASLFQGGARTPPAAAIERLRQNPAAAAQFDEVFGPGSAAQYLSR